MNGMDKGERMGFHLWRKQEEEIKSCHYFEFNEFYEAIKISYLILTAYFCNGDLM